MNWSDLYLLSLNKVVTVGGCAGGRASVLGVTTEQVTNKQRRMNPECARDKTQPACVISLPRVCEGAKLLDWRARPLSPLKERQLGGLPWR